MQQFVKIDDETTLEFEGGRLVKVNGFRPEYMDGYRLTSLVRKFARLLAKSDAARAYVAEAIASFEGEPADNDFQHGYLAALEVVGREALGMEIAEPELPPGERRARPKLVVHEGGK